MNLLSLLNIKFDLKKQPSYVQHVLSPVIWFLGKRKTVRKPVPLIVRQFFILISTFTSMVLMHLTLYHGSVFKAHNSPSVIPPWVCLCYLFLLLYN